jgi:hypothetical protein
MLRRAWVVVGVAVITALAPDGSAVRAQQPATPAAVAPRPWPDAARLAERKRIADGLPLFATQEPLTFNLLADFGAVQRDREESSNTTYPATIEVTRANGTMDSIPVRIRTRGHSRRKPINCTFAPLRIEFPTNPVGTVFEGQENLKLGTHCRDYGEYPQYVVREYPVYRMYNQLTPRSFRVRLAEAHYMDAKDRKPVRGRWSLFLEDDDDVASRQGGRASDITGLSFRRTYVPTTVEMLLFEYLIGNTDLSIREQHNVIVVESREGTHYTVPYDFDYSGVVDAPYAATSPALKLSSVRDRLYRGPCLTIEELEPFFARFRAKHDELLAAYDGVPLPDGYIRKAKSYLEGFFRNVDNPGRARREFVRDCNNRPYM